MEKALVEVDMLEACSQHAKVAASEISADFAVNINPHPATRKYTYEQEIGIAAYYLRHGDGLIKVEENHLKTFGKKGWEARSVLNTLGVDTSRGAKHKGLLQRGTIDDEIDKAAGIFQTTLKEIKKRGL